MSSNRSAAVVVVYPSGVAHLFRWHEFCQAERSGSGRFVGVHLLLSGHSADHGPRLSLTQTLGIPAQGGTDALLTHRTPAGPAGVPSDGLRDRRLEARFEYGFPAFGHRVTATPETTVGLSDAGRDYSLGYRLTPGVVVLELAFEARRFENTSRPNSPPEHAAAVRVTSRF